MSETEEWSTIQAGSAPEENKVEFEIEGEEEQQEAVEETQSPKKETEENVTASVSAEVEKEAEGIETSGAQKRIRQLVHQRKEREAQIEQLLEQQKEMQLKLQQREEEYKSLLNNNVESNERQVTERIELAKNAYRQAVESGDADRIVSAQEALNNAQFDSIKLTDFKKEIESFEPVKYTEQQQEQQIAQQPVAPNRKVSEWAEKNPWFNSDRVMTAAALEIDRQIQEEGFDPGEDDYYLEIDRQMAEQFPHKFGVTQTTPEPQATSQPAQVVAGASHTPAPSSSKKVKLSKEDVRLAEKWGISLEQYAAEKLKVEKAGQGEYTTINR